MKAPKWLGAAWSVVSRFVASLVKGKRPPAERVRDFERAGREGYEEGKADAERH